MTTSKKIAAFELLIERMKESPCSGMCRALISLQFYNKISDFARLYILGIIKAELVQQNSISHTLSVYLFKPYEMPPRIEWCEAKIKQLK